MTRSLRNSIIYSLLILMIGIGLSFALVVNAQNVDDLESHDSGSVNIDFPVEELGNCSSKAECKSYCDEPENVQACTEFAREHGLMSEEEVQRAERYIKGIQEGGPGGCNGPLECREYCNEVDHLEECLSFAERHGVNAPDMDEARRIAQYLGEGGEMPGGCRSKAECEEYCGDFRHARECFEFAQRVGIAQEGGSDDFHDGAGPGAPENMEKFIEIVEKGETPGDCRSRQECEKYCSSPDHMEECVEFGVRAGFISSQEAERMKQMRPPGDFPGGEMHPPEDFREIDHAPGEETYNDFIRDAGPEVVQCAKDALGSQFAEFKQGNLKPLVGSDLREEISQCFKKVEGVDELGPDAYNSEPYDYEEFEDNEDFQGDSSANHQPPKNINRLSPKEFLRGLPPEVMRCAETSIKDFDFTKVSPEDIKIEIEHCFREMEQDFGEPEDDFEEQPENNLNRDSFDGDLQTHEGNIIKSLKPLIDPFIDFVKS